MVDNIILIGFMGVGKGTTARALHQKYGIYIIDTDDLIESKENRKVKKIFANEGESYFRACEQATADWIASSVRGTCISCGGGFYKVNNLNALGTVVWLDAPFEWIYNRLKSAPNADSKLAKRPLFAKEKEAKALYRARQEAYREVADVRIDVANLTLDAQLECIAKACKMV
jgi:shikimate kinase